VATHCQFVLDELEMSMNTAFELQVAWWSYWCSTLQVSGHTLSVCLRQIGNGCEYLNSVYAWWYAVDVQGMSTHCQFVLDELGIGMNTACELKVARAVILMYHMASEWPHTVNSSWTNWRWVGVMHTLFLHVCCCVRGCVQIDLITMSRECPHIVSSS
jgi:hypothetical protein